MSRIVSCSAAREARELLPHRGARLGVEARRRLVEEEDARPVDEPHRDVEPPLLSARVGAHERVGLLGRARTARAARGARRSSVGAAHPLQPSLEDEVLEPRRLAVDPGGLRHVADRAPHRAGLAAHVVPGDRGRARRRPLLRVTRIRTVVDLPAPFGPSRPKTWPSGTENGIPSSARTSFPYVFSSPSTTIASMRRA